jgi:hypothetical protein
MDGDVADAEVVRAVVMASEAKNFNAADEALARALAVCAENPAYPSK